MSHFLGAKTGFGTSEAAEFRLYVLAGCRRLSCEDVSALAAQLQDCVRERRSWTGPQDACAAGAEIAGLSV